jgi:hypothetical protein
LNTKYSKKFLAIKDNFVRILDTENSKYQSLNLNCTGEMNKLQSVIVDAEWHYMGLHFTVTFKNKFFKSN